MSSISVNYIMHVCVHDQAITTSNVNNVSCIPLLTVHIMRAKLHHWLCSIWCFCVYSLWVGMSGSISARGAQCNGQGLSLPQVGLYRGHVPKRFWTHNESGMSLPSLDIMASVIIIVPETCRGPRGPCTGVALYLHVLGHLPNQHAQ